MKELESRKIPMKNYLILGLIFVVTLGLLYYFYLWADAYKETKLNRRIMDSYMEVINYNELADYLVESPNAIIYVAVLEDEKIREFEKKFKNAFKKNTIEKTVLYMDITEELKDKKITVEMQNKYKINDTDMTTVPLIMTFRDGKLDKIYDIASNNYDIEQVKLFINSIKNGDDLND